MAMDKILPSMPQTILSRHKAQNMRNMRNRTKKKTTKKNQPNPEQHTKNIKPEPTLQEARNEP